MNTRAYYLFGCLLLLLLGVFAQSAQAQISPNTVSGSYTGLNHINRIINGTPGITTTSVTGGVDATATGPVNFNRGGINVPIPTSVTGKVGAAAIGAAAGRIALRVLPWVGAALTIREVTNAAIADGWRVCPPPVFFCKDGLPLETKVVDSANSWKTASTNVMVTTTLTAHCTASILDNANKSNTGVKLRSTGATTASCDLYFLSNGAVYSPDWQRYVYVGNPTCPSGYVLSGSTCIKPGPDIKASDTDLGTSVGKAAGSKPGLHKDLYDDIKSTEQANPHLGQVINPSAIPVTLNAPAVVYPATQVSTKTEPNADGNGTKTTTVAEQVTVTPTMGSPATLADPKITFPTTTTTTTTVINNVTNVTNITTEVRKEEPANTEKPEPLPKDYNREATQLKILEQLDGSTVGEAPADQEQRVKTKVADVDAKLDLELPKIPTEYDSDKGKWFSWVWVPPMSQCTSSTYSTTVRGYAVSWDICPWVENMRQFVGFIWALIGCLSIYSQMFKRGE